MELSEEIRRISLKSDRLKNDRALLVGISGIDASGKGFVTAGLAEDLVNRGRRPAAINIDGWLNLPHIRFSQTDPAENFYERALRLEETFERLILPLKRDRSVRLVADFAEETATSFRKHEYVYNDVDIILLEGIFLFKKQFVDYFDLRIWIECSFETAMERAVARSQEGLERKETIEAYETIYFPAQRIHFDLDQPQDAADLTLSNN